MEKLTPIQNKPVMLIRAPLGTRSGYGEMSRDIIRHIIALDTYDVKLWSVRWGSTPMNALSAANPKDVPIIERVISGPQEVTSQPDVFISITIPIEFEPVGKYNIGITAGIETDVCVPSWIVGCNKMPL